MSRVRLPCGSRCVHPWNGTTVTLSPASHCSSRVASAASSESLGRSRSMFTSPATMRLPGGGR
eukprot:9665071-Lingulodinium_polyedra.AAC.1